MKLLELSTGNYKLVEENGIIRTFSSLEEMDKIYGFQRVFEFVMDCDYVNIEGYKPDIFTTKINGRYRVLYPNGRVEMLEAHKDCFLKFKGNYRKIYDKKNEDEMVLHWITYQNGTEEILSLKEALEKSFVEKIELLFP